MIKDNGWEDENVDHSDYLRKKTDYLTDPRAKAVM